MALHFWGDGVWGCGSGALAANCCGSGALAANCYGNGALAANCCGSGALAAIPRCPLMRETAIPKPHSHDLRKGRISEADRIYLITTVTHERLPFFQDWWCGRLVVKALMGESAHAQTLAFVVMPDHLHWLLQLGENTTLPTVVRHVKSVSAHHLNQALNRQGKVWQAGYHDHALRHDEDVVSIARYVVANPLRKGLVARLGDYPLWDAIWLPG